MRATIKKLEEWTPDYYPLRVVHFEWCCDCDLRHLVEYDVVKHRGRLYVKRKVQRDDWATQASRRLKNLARRKKHGSKRRA